MTASRIVLSLLLSAATCAVSAQQSADPLFADQPEDDAEAPRTGSFYADLALRSDQVSGLEGRDDIQRLRSRLRLGWQGSAEHFDYAIAAKLALGSDANRDARAHLDNEKSDAAVLDEALLRWNLVESSQLTLGKTALPFDTTPLTWDTDLRPIGASWRSDFAMNDFDRLSLVLGYFAPDHLYGDDSRLAGAQAGWHWHEGAPFSAELLVGYYDFSALENLTRERLSRTNRRVGNRLVSDYRLLDLQGALRWDIDGDPLTARLDVVENLGADELSRGARFSVIYGDSRQPHGLELAVAVQRFQRDAVMAAFTADDWWFHSFARGVMPWIAYGFNATWSAQLSGFHERRDDQDGHVNRVLLDVRAVW